MEYIKEIEYCKEIKFKKIYHIADIHIKNNLSFHEEYKYVFNELYKFLKTNNKNSILVICGDILHTSNNISPETQNLCVLFFSSLSKILPTIIIAGNHDVNINCNIVIDALSSIIYYREEKFSNLYYLRDSGIYKFGNISFGVSSIIDNKIIKAKDISNESIKVGLYHGAVSNSTNSIGFEFSDKSITIFDGYDYVLLGDIHKFQYLNDNKTIAYSSSLISQSMSETDEYHGVLVWNLYKRYSKYKIINNPYRNIQLDIINNIIYYNNVIYDIENLSIPEYAKVRCNIDNSNNAKYIKTQIINKFPNIIYKKDLISNICIENNPTNPNNNINEININYELLINKITENIKSEYKNKIIDIIKNEINDNITINNKEINNWKIISLEFSNLFCFGNNNIIDFNNLDYNEINGLCGDNSIGKSSLIDIICIGLFNNYSRNISNSINKTKKSQLLNIIINNNFKNFIIKLTFIVNNKTYLINKIGKAKHNNNSIKYETYTLSDITNNEPIILSTQLEKTNNTIIELIGTYEDFCISTIMFQAHLNYNFDFYNMSSYIRKTFLYRKLNLDYFEIIKDKYIVLLSTSKKEYNSNDNKIAQLNYNDYDNTILNNKNIELNNINIELNNINIKLNINNNKLIEYNNIIDNLKNTCVSDNFISCDINNLLSQKLNITLEIQDNNNKINDLKLIVNKEEITNQPLIIENKINKLYSKINKTTINNKLDLNTNSLLNLKDFLLKIITDINNKIIDNHKIIEQKHNIINNKNRFMILYNNITIDENIINNNKFILNIESKYNKYKKLLDKYYENEKFILLLQKCNFNDNCNDCNNNKNIINEYLINIKYSKIIKKHNKYKILLNNNNILLKEFYSNIIDDYNYQLNQIEINTKYINKFNNDIFICKQLIINIDNILINNKIIYYKQIKLISNYTVKNIELNNLLIQINYTYENKIIQNNITSAETIIKTTTAIINALLLTKTNLNNKVDNLNILINNLINTKNMYDNIIIKQQIINDDIYIYNNIIKIFSCDGLAVLIIKSKLKIIEDNINNMIYNIIHKKIIIDSDTNNININIIDSNNTVCNYFGGMEYFVVTICFKIFFNSFLNISTCGLLIIDEGVSVFSNNSIHKFPIIANFIKQYYNNIILITHIDAFKDFITNNIIINKRVIKNKSYVACVNF